MDDLKTVEQPNAVDLEGSLVLGVNGRSDLWSFCPNSTAGGRMDVVWAAKANHAHYVESKCVKVDLHKS